jgi:hypothetical protein
MPLYHSLLSSLITVSLEITFDMQSRTFPNYLDHVYTYYQK